MNKRLEYLESNFNTLSEEELKYLRMIVDDIIDKDNLSLIEKKLIMKLAIREKCKQYGYPVIDIDFESFGNKEGGKYVAKEKRILLNEDELNSGLSSDSTLYPYYSDITTELDRMLLIANHECEHYFQKYDLENNKLTKGSFAFLLYHLFNRYTPVSPNGKSEYQVNYNYKEIENYANTQGWYDTGMFLVRHKSSKVNRELVHKLWLQSSVRQNVSYQKNKDGKTQIIEDYNMETLRRIVYIHPSLVEQYPLLSTFFYGKDYDKESGKLKGLDVLLSQYLKIEQDYGHGKTRYQVEEEKYVYRQFFYYLLGKDASIVSNGYETLLYDLALYDLISLQGIFDIAKKAPKSYERVSKIKADRINAFVDRLEELKAYELCDNLRDKTQETLRVYETSKLMYRDTNNNVEASMLCLRNRFDLTEVESRNPEGRKSAINI